MLLSSSLWLISLNVWSFEVHPPSDQWYNFIISVVLFYGCGVCQWTFLKLYFGCYKQNRSECWGACIFIERWLSQDISPGVGMSGPRMGSLERFFFDTWRLCFLVAVVNVHFHWTQSGVTSPGGSLLHLLSVDLRGWPVWLVDFAFPSLFWLVFRQQLGPLLIYSCGGGLLFVFLVSFTWKGVRKIYCGNWLHETLLCL